MWSIFENIPRTKASKRQKSLDNRRFLCLMEIGGDEMFSSEETKADQSALKEVMPGEEGVH